jgi:hypothetical protein
LAPEVKSNSNVFFITTNTDGFYELFFGNDVFGKSVNAGQMIETTFVLSSGKAGNGVGEEYGKHVDWNVGSDGGNTVIDEDYDYPVSSGGSDEETVEELRFNIPNHYKRQNRIVTKDDYRSIILSEFRNVDAINVWGGEEGLFKEYGKVFVSVKPKHSSSLSFNAKKELSEGLLKKYSILGSDVIFVDPDFISIDFKVTAKYDPNKTDKSRGQIASLLFAGAKEYEVQSLNKFQTVFSEVDFLSFIRAKDKGIVSLYTEKTLRKQIKLRYDNPLEIIVVYGNSIQPGSLETAVFLYGTTFCVLTEISGQLFIVNSTTRQKVVQASVGTVDSTTGVIRLKLPTSGIKMLGDADNGYEGKLTMIVTPVHPDIESSMNNILRIGEFKEVKINA